MRTPHPLVLPAATAPVLFVPPLQHHRPAEHETGHGREQAQGDHCQEHLGPAAAAPQALEAEPHLPGGPTGGPDKPSPRRLPRRVSTRSCNHISMAPGFVQGHSGWDNPVVL